MNNEHDSQADSTAQPAASTIETSAASLPWEMIEPGRYQPKRTRGSCVGRELG